MSTLYVNNIEPVSGSSLTLISASLVSVDNLSVASLTSSFQGDLTGTASFAVTASHALNSTSAAGTEGQVQFNSGSEFGADSNLFWDNTNKRLGIGTNAPSSAVEIVNDDFNQVIFGVKTSQSSNTFRIFNSNSPTTPVWQIGSSSPDTRIQMFSTMIFRVNGTGLAEITSSEVRVGGATGARLAVKGSGSTSATTSLLVQNSSGTDLMKIDDLGNVFLGSTSGAVNIVSGYNNRFLFNRLSFYGANTNIRGMASGGQGIIVSKNSGITDLYPTAIFAIDSTTQGFLPPRMTTAQKNAISSPASGLMVYDTDTNKLCCYNGTSWNDLF